MPGADLPTLSQLPHRAPFLLVDRLVSTNEGEALAVRRVTVDDPLVGDELPGSLVIEALAQTAALLQSTEVGAHRGFLVALRDVKLAAPVHAGDTLTLRAKRTAVLGGLHRVTASAHVDERIVASGELTFAVESA